MEYSHRAMRTVLFSSSIGDLLFSIPPSLPFPVDGGFPLSIFHAPTALPPSTSRLTPVMNLPSSLAKKAQMFATSLGSVNRPNGTLKRNFFIFSSVYGTPTNCSKSPVPDSRGHMALTRIWSLPNSAARPFVAYTNNHHRTR